LQTAAAHGPGASDAAFCLSPATPRWVDSQKGRLLMDEYQRAKMRELWDRLSPLADAWLNCDPPKAIDPVLLETNWQQALPYLDWNEKGGLGLDYSADGSWCVPVKPNSKLPAEVKGYVVYSTTIDRGVRVDRPLLPLGTPPLADYELVKQFHNHQWIYEGKRAWDEIAEAIADPDNEQPIPRAILRQSPELAAWLNGELPGYAPTITEYKVLWPAFIERRRKLRERGLANPLGIGSQHDSERNIHEQATTGRAKFSQPNPTIAIENEVEALDYGRRNANPARQLIQATGNSPLSRYVDLLVLVPENLKRLLDRDAEAVRILKAEPALKEARLRADRWYWDRQRAKQTGGIVLTPRIWTRRDEQRVNMQRGLLAGCWPVCRAARYLAWLEPRSGPSLHDQWFRRAVDEARQDGTAAVLCPKLDQAKAVYDRLISAARSIAQDDGGQPEFTNERLELGNLACELMDWTKAPAKKCSEEVRAALSSNNARDTGRSASNPKSTDPPKIEELERDTPKLDKNNDQWLKANDKRMRREATVKSLKSMRNAISHGARKSADGKFGIDKTGRYWRKESAAATTVYYWVVKLKGQLPKDKDRPAR